VLVDLVPYTRDGKPGLRVTVEAEKVNAWAKTNAAWLVERGRRRLRRHLGRPALAVRRPRGYRATDARRGVGEARARSLRATVGGAWECVGEAVPERGFFTAALDQSLIYPIQSRFENVGRDGGLTQNTMEGMSMVRQVVSLLLVIAGAAACATLNAAATRSTEDLLSAAGFQLVAADTPETLVQLHSLPPQQIVATASNGETSYVYSDPDVCKCLYVGTASQYREYQRLRRQQDVADEQDLDPWRDRTTPAARR
jgi:hypothetical protein